MIINSKRVQERIEKIASMSVDPTGGFTRLAFSDKDIAARELVTKMMEEAGLKVRRDAAGNLLGTFAEDERTSGFLATGSHIDTVKNGGKFDGLLGTIAAIEVAQTIREQGLRMKNPLEIVVFSDEEGARFNSGMIGSKSIAGIPLDAPPDTFVDQDGVSVSQTLRQMGIDPERILDAKAPAGTFKAFVEMHIEQSIVLEQSGNQIGVVNAIKGPYWIKGVFEGESNHAGGTPMNIRRDPMVAAAHFIAEVDRIAKEIGDMFVATVGVVNVFPGGINTIPARVEFTIDIRDVDMERRAKGIARIEQAARDIAEKLNVTSSLECIKDSRAENMTGKIMDTISQVCQEQNISHQVLSSGPFHDALTMTSVCDVGMIFVPSIGGVSHSPFEDTKWKDVFTGTEVLYRTIVALDELY